MSTERPDDPLIGTHLGGYVIEALLGKGAMGAVYRAVQVSLNRPVALKVMAGHLVGSAESAARFWREARAAAAINHPNLIHVHDFGEAGGVYFYAMELVDGLSLGEYLRRGDRFTERECIEVGREVTLALRAAHRAGVIHRDLKPDNLMLNSEGVVKVADLGVARFLSEGRAEPAGASVEDRGVWGMRAWDSLTMTGAGVGTPAFMSPEQIRAEKGVDHRSDFYALGATLFQLATCRAPFPADTAAEVLEKQLSAPVPRARDVNPALGKALSELIGRLMAKSPDERPQTHEEILEALEACLRAVRRRRGGASRVRAAVGPTWTGKLVRHWPTLVGAAALTVAAGLVSGRRSKESGPPEGARLEQASEVRATAVAVAQTPAPGTSVVTAMPMAATGPDRGQAPPPAVATSHTRENTLDSSNGVSQKLASIPADKFSMGSPGGEGVGRRGEGERGKTDSTAARQVQPGAATAFAGSSPANAQIPFTFTTNNGAITIIKYTGSGGAVAIPGTINGLLVTGIGNDVFWECTNATSVTIPAGVTSMGANPFDSNRWDRRSSLLSISVDAANPAYCSSPDGVVFNRERTCLVSYPGAKAGGYAIPGGVTTIGEAAFAGCYNLTSVTIPNSVTSIGDAAFGACSALRDVTIPGGVTNIGDAAFWRCASLVRMRIPASVISIGPNPFAGCGGLTGIVVDAANPVYSGSADSVLFDKGKTRLLSYSACKARRYVIPGSVTNIGAGAFAECAKLANIAIPNTVTSIGGWAFGSCSNLGNVTLPESVTSIGDGVFCDCSGLTNAVLPDRATSIGFSAFYRCIRLSSITIPMGVTSIRYATFLGCEALTSVRIPSGVTSIDENAFRSCTNLTQVTIPNTVTRIRGHAFCRCTSLSNVYFLGNAPATNPDVCMFNRADHATVYHLAGAKGWGETFAGRPTAVWDPQATNSVPLAAPGLPSATKDRPFVNMLGMKFVPVPGTKVLFSVWETRVQDFGAFANVTGHDMGTRMYVLQADGWKEKDGYGWRNPGFMQGADHPVVGVNWDDAGAFCRWLTDKERRDGRIGQQGKYRLPTDQEWSCASGIGDREDPKASPKDKDGKIEGAYPWGKGWPPPKGAGNYAGQESRVGQQPSLWRMIDGYRDGFPKTAPVGSFAPNAFGLHDMGGNVCEWCEDAFEAGREDRVLRGGAWCDGNESGLRSSRRYGYPPDARRDVRGFRCVLSASPP